MTVLKKSKQRLQWYIQVRVTLGRSCICFLIYYCFLDLKGREKKLTPARKDTSCEINPFVILVIINYFQIKRRKSQLMSTTCGHVFCDKCIRSAVQLQRRCPTCRKKLSLKQLHAIFL